TVLADAEQQKPTHYVCLGDVVGYNANPKECLDIVRNMDIPCVKGNHDEYCSTDDHLEGFNPNAGVTSLTNSPPPPVFPTRTPSSVFSATLTCPSPSCAIPSCAAAPIPSS